MHWWSVLVVALAAPVWSRSHGHGHGHQHAKVKESVTSRATTPGRAVWMWNSDLIQEDAEVEQFLSFAETNTMNTVYALIDRDMGNAVFESFISKCHAKGIAVEALMGNSLWIIEAGDPTLESQLEWIEQYQGNATADASFAGIHMDVEPWGLDEWELNQGTYIARLQSIVTQVTSLGKALGLPVSADLPYWAYTITCPTTGQTLDTWMLDNLDTATFMTYRNTAAELIDIASKVLEAGNAAGKPVWLAVETVDAADALLISYFGKTVSALYEDLASVHAKAATYASFAGIAIHDYGGLKALGS
ncbi:Uu.00g076490.m01.CDS01 [Anthostomella pinea]|uniref:Uu.00g076490.m01.CDS01 n=1 Tax=Anthostomella pinea TaxID=933095 RepID=A0AAI8VVV8_9PEZI|nr:Uu.00g076490.m01.CDS01 [Anthostomella pinea]